MIIEKTGRIIKVKIWKIVVSLPRKNIRKIFKNLGGKHSSGFEIKMYASSKMVVKYINFGILQGCVYVMTVYFVAVQCQYL